MFKRHKQIDKAHKLQGDILITISDGVIHRHKLTDKEIYDNMMARALILKCNRVGK